MPPSLPSLLIPPNGSDHPVLRKERRTTVRANLRHDDDDTITAGNRSPKSKGQGFSHEEYRRRRRLLSSSPKQARPPPEEEHQEESRAEPASAVAAAPDPMSSLLNSTNMLTSNLGMYGGLGGYNNGMMMMGGYGGYPTAYGAGPLSWVNQCMFGIQNLLFSVTQVIQIVSMNTNTVHQLYEAVRTILQHAVQAYQQHIALDDSPTSSKGIHTVQQRQELAQRRRKLRMIRSALVSLTLYTGYKLVRWLFTKNSRTRQTLSQPAFYGNQWHSTGSPTPAIASQPYHYGNHSLY
jgi:hypothetical protein